MSEKVCGGFVGTKSTCGPVLGLFVRSCHLSPEALRAFGDGVACPYCMAVRLVMNREGL